MDKVMTVGQKMAEQAKDDVTAERNEKILNDMRKLQKERIMTMEVLNTIDKAIAEMVAKVDAGA